ncbi:hypothetical protein MPLA_930032 [Mesorhizobium sp. ORS 3359]|nr:hypothetical protein MPLA_930032 [Mesorhizobium sp. ORS 3359]
MPCQTRALMRTSYLKSIDIDRRRAARQGRTECPVQVALRHNCVRGAIRPATTRTPQSRLRAVIVDFEVTQLSEDEDVPCIFSQESSSVKQPIAAVRRKRLELLAGLAARLNSFPTA